MNKNVSMEKKRKKLAIFFGVLGFGEEGFFFVHVLCMAGIHDGYGVAIDDVGEIPLVGVCHVVTFPSTQGGFTSQKSTFYLVDGIKGIIGIFVHQLLGVCMLVLLGDIAIECCYLFGATLLDNISI